jgi:hypothetical protein
MTAGATNTEDLVRRCLGRVGFTAPAGRLAACCFKALEAWRDRRAAGARCECPECGQVLKAVLLGGHRAGRDDVLARGDGAAGAIAKEAEPSYRIAGVFLSRAHVSPAAVEAALSRAGLAPGGPVETEFGWWAGAAPDGALGVEAERGVWLVLEEIAVG